ncbi:MAG: hypothetical protein ABFC73_11810 [Clostridiaceae bacterium]
MSAQPERTNVVVGIVRTPDPLNLCAELYRRALEQLRKMRGVEVIESERELDSAASAALVADEFTRRSVDLSLILCCRLAGDGKIVEPFMRSGQELAVWSVPEPQRTGYLLLNSLTCANLYLSAAEQLSADCRNKKAKWLYGEPENPYFARRIKITIDAIRAVKCLSEATILRVGATTEGFTNLQFHAQSVFLRHGVKTAEADLKLLAERMDRVPQEKAIALAERMHAWAMNGAGFEHEVNQSARLALALESLRQETGADALALRCWPEIQGEWKFSACLAVSYLNEMGTIVSCESDVPGALSMLLAHEVSGGHPLLLDLVAADLERDALQFWHCGVGMRCYMDGAGCGLMKYPCDAKVLDLPGACVNMKFAPKQITICRLYGDDAGRLFVCEAEFVEGPDAGFDGGRGWVGNFTMEGRPVSAAGFLDIAFGAGMPHHYALCEGHFEAALREFALRGGLETVPWSAYTDELRRQ